MAYGEGEVPPQDEVDLESPSSVRINLQPEIYVDRKFLENVIKSTLVLMTREEINGLLKKGIIFDFLIIIGTIISGKFLSKDMELMSIDTFLVLLGFMLILIGLMVNAFLIHWKLKETKGRLAVRVSVVPR